MALGDRSISWAILAGPINSTWKALCQLVWKTHLWQLGDMVAHNGVGGMDHAPGLAGRAAHSSTCHRSCLVLEMYEADQKGSHLAGELNTLPQVHKLEAMATFSITTEFLSDILVTAFDGNYGGCWYWCEPHESPDIVGRQDSPAQGNHEDIWLSVSVVDNNNKDKGKHGKTYTINHAILMKGIKAILHDGKMDRDLLVRAIATNDSSDLDADWADTIVQYGLWGKEIYG